jgi:hypothetical protein
MKMRFTLGLVIGLAFAAGTALAVTSIPYISGTLTSGHCLQATSDGLGVIDAGSACASTTGFASLSTAQVFTASQGVTPSALSGTTVAVDGSLSNVFTLTLTGTTTISNPTNFVAGKTYTFIITQASGGGDTVTWSSDYKWPGATAPTMTATANAVDMQTCVATSSSVCLFGAAQQNVH